MILPIGTTNSVTGVQPISQRRTQKSSIAGRVRKKEELEAMLKRNIEVMQAQLERVKAEAEKDEMQQSQAEDRIEMEESQTKKFEALILE